MGLKRCAGCRTGIRPGESWVGHAGKFYHTDCFYAPVNGGSFSYPDKGEYL